MAVRHLAPLSLILLLLTAAVPAVSPMNATLDSVVQVTAFFTVRDSAGDEKVHVFQGSGWTSACRSSPHGYRLVAQTAAHVVDPARLELEGSWKLVRVHYRVDYRDGSMYRIPQEAIQIRAGDSATLEFSSPVPRPTLRTADPGRVEPGDRLLTLACPEGLRFVAVDGVYSATLAQAGLSQAVPPQWEDSWWLSTVPAMPGSSGAPVFDERGGVVAHIVGRLEGPGGSFSILQPREVKP